MNNAFCETGPRRRVLVVEDDSSNANLLRILLSHYHFDITHAPAVVSAIAALKIEPDAILLDLILPDGDGTAVLEAVRERQLRSHVIVVTGTSDRAKLVRVQKLSPLCIKIKPIDFLEVLEKLRSAMEPQGQIADGTPIIPSVI